MSWAKFATKARQFAGTNKPDTTGKGNPGPADPRRIRGGIQGLLARAPATTGVRIAADMAPLMIHWSCCMFRAQ
jgi:hypothetical protein